MSSLPPERLSELRQAIHGHVSRGSVQEQIRNCLSEALAQEGGRQLEEKALLQVLEERGLVDQVMNTLDLSPTRRADQPTEKTADRPTTERTDYSEVSRHYGILHATPKPSHAPPPKVEVTAVQSKAPPLSSTTTTTPTSKRCLFLQVLGGRAFLDHLSDSTSCPHAHFTLHIHFRGQRYHSRDVACACEPDFREGFLLELEKTVSSSIFNESGAGFQDGGRSKGRGRMISCADALSISDPIQVALTRTNHRGEVDLVGTCELEWRQVLCKGSGRVPITVELTGIGPEAKITPGILDMRVDLMPRPPDPLHSDLLAAQLGLEKQRRSERERLFLVYAKQWWKEFLQLRSVHAQRLVKIFAADEAGVSRLVCSYVRPLRAGRLLDSPRHAARFVSLVPFEKTGTVGHGGSCSELWASGFALLVNSKGDCEAHACLLCSLLLGFGLEAYVCIGSKSKGLAHAWVMTRSQNGGVVFWESITGQRYVHTPFDPNTQAGMPLPLPAHPYRTMGCVFNHRSFHANCQPSDNITTCNFDLRNTSLWKVMSPEAIRSVVGSVCSSSPCPLLPPTGDSALAANEIETQLRNLTFNHREDLGLTTDWDDDLCYLLTPALSAYETERCLGVGGVGNEEFQEAVRNSVPNGHTFKGFPIQLPYRNPRKIFNACLQSPVCAEILGCKGDHMRLAVRVKVYFYLENICAVWIMFAAKYKSIL